MAGKRWPPIPRVVDGTAGPIKVVVRRAPHVLSQEKDQCWGLYRPEKRKILLAGKVPPALRWHSLAHEWAHAWIEDAGLGNLIHGTSEEKQRNLEVICDTFATAFVRSMAAHLGLDPYTKA